MTRDDDNDEWVLSTGRRFYAHTDLLSPGIDGDLLYGSDGTSHPDDDEDELFTSAERQEIAEYMIKRWRKWVDYED
jgi:hypothetical protein